MGELSVGQLHAVLTASPVAIYTSTLAGDVSSWNPAAERLFGWPADDAIGRPIPFLLAEETSVHRDRCAAVLRGQRIDGLALAVATRTGALIAIALAMAPLRADDGSIAGIVALAQGVDDAPLATILDATTRTDAERALRDSEAQYRAVVAALEEGIVVVSRDHTLLASNTAAETILRRSRDAIARWVTDFADWRLVHGDGAECPAAAVPIRRALETGQPAATAEIGVDRPDGSRVWISMNARALFHPRETTPFAAVASFADITERRDVEARLQHQAFYDSLTGLPNRALFVDRLAQAVALASRRGDALAVACLDLDRFKVVNDTLGHEAGDHLLCAVAQRLAECARESDTVARMGGDEFMMILPGIHDIGGALAAAHRFLAVLHPALEVGGHELSISASIGVTVYPTDGEDVGTLMRNADRAMYRAKEVGKGDVCAFAADDRGGAPSRLAIESQLRRAIERGELRLDYQPQIDLVTGATVAVEALLRWHNRELGAIAPARIIPIAEETGLIVALGEWVLLHACGHVVEWMAAGHPAQRVAVNVSPVQFRRGDFVAMVTRVLRTSGLPATLLELELTENLILRDIDVVIDRIAELHEMGVSIALDDFGVGTSSLVYLQHLPIDTLKIDRSFVRDLESHARRSPAAIVQPLIALAHGLGMTVVAEGVETPAQLARLRTLGCDRAQGFAIAAPAQSLAHVQLRGA